MERLIGLTEMFPPGLITGIKDLSTGSVGAVKWTYSKSRNLTWIVFSSAAILFLPVNIDNYTDVRQFFGYKINDKIRLNLMFLSNLITGNARVRESGH